MSAALLTAAAPDPAALIELFQRRIDAERLEAAQDQWQRLQRLNGVLAGGVRANAEDIAHLARILGSPRLARAAESLQAIAAELEAGPLRSPEDMQRDRLVAAELATLHRDVA